MNVQRKQYSKEFKIEIVQEALSEKSVLELGKENNISPGFIKRRKRRYLKEE